MQIKNCTAVITGGASGMGLATAKYLQAQGAKVALLDLNEAALTAAATSLNVLSVPCDVTNEDQVQNALTTIKAQLGNIRILVNCAGIVHGRRMVNQHGPMPLAEFKQVIDVNLIGTFNMMRLTAAMMVPIAPSNTGERGVIINTASVAAFDGQIGQTAYSASKGAIVGMTLPAARELAQFGIRVMTIAPGLVDTPMFAKLNVEARAALAEAVPFPKRLAQPEEYAMLVNHIIENEMLNGEVIRLDGALRMQAK